MRLSLAAAIALTSALFVCTACSEDATDAASTEDDLATKAFAYTCTTASSRVLEDADSIEVAVSNGLLRVTDGFGAKLGERDAKYRAPKNTSRARFTGFEYGGDCSLSLVVDEGALRGAARPQLRVQCAGDDFLQDVYTCGAAKPTRLSRPKPAAPNGPGAPTGPAADAKTWTCTSAAGRILEDRVSVQVDDGAMRLVADDLVYEATRDRKYKPKTGDFFRYDGFDYGGDCSLSAVVSPTMLGNATSAALKIRCAGDDFIEDRYTCTSR